jgi:preprotein translocase subunit YajC
MMQQACLPAILSGLKPAASAASFLLLQAASGSGLVMFLPLILIFGVFYVLLILPQQRKQKKWQEMLNTLKTGDRVVTSGGIRGIIIALRDDFVHLRVAPDNLKIEVARSAIVSLSAEEKGS